jgi:hypothetical protein
MQPQGCSRLKRSRLFDPMRMQEKSACLSGWFIITSDISIEADLLRCGFAFSQCRRINTIYVWVAGFGK